ncbi:CBS domain-containing protein [Candidatus Bipolaricaulota bacterium]|nr:CBS domain-containing protein [Candidatus Bipolaricaulota bacterium]
MKVHEIMTRDLTSVESDVTIRELIFILDNARMPNIPVVNDANQLIGIISEKDLIRAALPGYFDMLHSASFIPDLNQMAKRLGAIIDDPAEKHMQRSVLHVLADDDVLQAADLIIRKDISNIPVVDGEGQLVGRVKRIDLLKPYA